MNLAGLGVAIITPFTVEGEVDYKAIPRIVDHIVMGGADYLVIMGTTAETPTVLLVERKQIIEKIISANNGRLPMVIGIGGNNTKGVIEEIKATDLTPFEAILSVSPYYNKPSQEGIYHHYKKISAASPKPIIVYNVPSRTSSNIEIETFVHIAEDCANVIGIKDANGDFAHVQMLLKSCPERIQVVSGDDALALPTILAGGVGSISVLGNALPKEVSDLILLAKSQKVKEAYDLQFRLLDLMNLIFEEGNPTGIKALMAILTLSTNTVRLPLMRATDQLTNKIEQCLDKLTVDPSNVQF